MTVEQSICLRCGFCCELCAADSDLHLFPVPPHSDGSETQSLLVCTTCLEQIEKTTPLEPTHWRCLHDSMWSEVPAVQVMAWRLLTRLYSEAWARDLLDMLFLEKDVLAWAQAEEGAASAAEISPHIDSNGSILAAGDTVTLVKDLVVKGGGFTAKRGTAVRGIVLVADNPEHIEGRVNGQKIVILTQFVKKSG